jgi:hypothetical protein
MMSIRVGGDHLSVTADHSLFRINDGTLSSVPSDEFVVGDVVPLDDGRNWEGEERVVDVLSAVATLKKVIVAVDLSTVERADLGATAWEWQNFRRQGRYGHYLPYERYIAHSSILPKPTLIYTSGRRSAAMPPTFKLSEWAYILGFLLGDGWIGNGKGDHGRISFAVELQRADAILAALRSLPHVALEPTFRKMPGASVEIRMSHQIAAAVIQQALGGNKRCYDKSIPGEWIVSWPRMARHQLLRGLLDSDGSIQTRGSHRRCYYSTSSHRLARSLLALLRSLGIVGSIHTRQPSRGGTVNGRTIVSARPSYMVHWSWHAMDGNNDGRRGARVYVDSFRNGCHQAKIRSIGTTSTRPDEYVYDVEMYGHPSFAAGGVLAHNSATPVANYGGEIWNVLNVVSPNEIGDFQEFCREWCRTEAGYGGTSKAIIKAPDAFGHYAREQGLMLRRTRAEVGRELPPLTKIVQPVDCDMKPIEDVQSAASELARIILQQGGKAFDKMRAAEELDWRLRQATGVAKAAFVADFVRMLVENGESVILTGWHREVYALWLERLNNLKPVMYTGSESLAEKERSRATFMSGESPILIISLRSGSGLDGLQHRCQTIVHGELDWSPAMHAQVDGRAHRDGQTMPVSAFYMLADSGSDPVISDALGLKQHQLDGILDPDAAPVVGATDPNRVKRLAEAFLEQQGKRRVDSADSDEEAA